MINLRNLNAAMEGFSMEDGDADVSIEQTIEIEVAADEEAQEVVEVEEAVAENDDIAEETEQMLATLEFAAHAEAVVEEFGWSRPVAAMLNRGQNVEESVQGDLEMFLGVVMPSNESLDMVSSAYDDNTVVALESFKSKMESVWKWIKEQATKIKNFVMALVNRVVEFFTSLDKASQRYAEAIGKMTKDEEKWKKHEAKLVPYDRLQMKKVSDVSAELNTQMEAIGTAVGTILGKVDVNSLTEDKVSSLAKEIDDATAKIVNTKKGALSKLGIKASKDGGLDFSKFLEGYKPTKMLVSKSGYTIENTKTNTLVIANANAARGLPKVVKGIVSLVKGIESMASRVGKTASDEKLAAAAKKGADLAKKSLKVLTEIQGMVGKISKFLMHLCRCFIAGQRAVLACRK